jgi:PIH1 N-terminal domain
VYDVIWNPKTVERCKTDPTFRQIVVELAFSHIQQKGAHELDLRFTIPKMKYKGKTVQFQRVRAKKGPKITEVGREEMSEEERVQMENRSLEH